MSAPTAWRARPGVVAHGRDGNVYVTDTRSGEVYAVNATALQVFEGARSGHGLDALVAALALAHPEVPREEIAADVAGILAQFTARGLLEEVIAEPGPAQR